MKSAYFKLKARFREGGEAVLGDYETFSEAVEALEEFHSFLTMHSSLEYVESLTIQYVLVDEVEEKTGND